MLLLIAAGTLSAQFAEVNVGVDMEQLKVVERQELQGIDETIRQFYLTSQWGKEIDNLDMTLDLQLVFQSTIDIANVKYYQAQALFHNRLDQRYFIKNIKFPYSRGQSMRLSTVYDPLSSTFAFYAYIMIAGELDTYDLMGGAQYYSAATSLASSGENEPNVGGEWTERIRLVERLSLNKELRRCKAYFYQALDALAGEKPDLPRMTEALRHFHSALNTIYLRKGQDRYTGIFLMGHAAE
ncbi:MAG: DUF4835 family protein, partial [Candidatus Marinimicrobia bacterium]|nr:DUF4835 family protein [Candidatus Neomarinimicrobiota bacterium]